MLEAVAWSLGLFAIVASLLAIYFREEARYWREEAERLGNPPLTRLVKPRRDFSGLERLRAMADPIP